LVDGDGATVASVQKKDRISQQCCGEKRRRRRRRRRCRTSPSVGAGVEFGRRRRCSFVVLRSGEEAREAEERRKKKALWG
jgi:hypothetical protein